MKKTFYLIALSLVCTILIGCTSSKPAHPSAEPGSLEEAQSSEATPDKTVLVSAKPDTLNNDALPMVVEDMPMLIGGLGSIQRRVKYPAHLRKKGIKGRVFVQFVVDVHGNVTQLRVARSVHPELDRLALDAVSQARFKPGKQKGVPVAVKMSLPITFGTK